MNFRMAKSDPPPHSPPVMALLSFCLPSFSLISLTSFSCEASQLIFHLFQLFILFFLVVSPLSSPFFLMLQLDLQLFSPIFSYQILLRRLTVFSKVKISMVF